MTLTKAAIAQKVYLTHPTLTKAQSVESVEQFLAIAKAVMIAGNDLLLSGFGKFRIKDKAPRRGRNPRTGEVLQLPSRRVITFQQSYVLRARLNAT